MLEQFFPNGVAHYLIGGLILGVAVSLAYLFTGVVAGMSTVFTTTWSYVSPLRYLQRPRFLESRHWRAVLALGVVAGGAMWLVAFGTTGAQHDAVSPWQILFGSVVSGFGARMSNGCTSGHGICGMASLQLPSILAVVTFLTTGILTAHAVGMLGGG